MFAFKDPGQVCGSHTVQELVDHITPPFLPHEHPPSLFPALAPSCVPSSTAGMEIFCRCGLRAGGQPSQIGRSCCWLRCGRETWRQVKENQHLLFWNGLSLGNFLRFLAQVGVSMCCPRWASKRQTRLTKNGRDPPAK